MVLFAMPYRSVYHELNVILIVNIHLFWSKCNKSQLKIEMIVKLFLLRPVFIGKPKAFHPSPKNVIFNEIIAFNWIRKWCGLYWILRKEQVVSCSDKSSIINYLRVASSY